MRVFLSSSEKPGYGAPLFLSLPSPCSPLKVMSGHGCGRCRSWWRSGLPDPAASGPDLRGPVSLAGEVRLPLRTGRLGPERSLVAQPRGGRRPLDVPRVCAGGACGGIAHRRGPGRHGGHVVARMAVEARLCRCVRPAMGRRIFVRAGAVAAVSLSFLPQGQLWNGAKICYS